MGSGSGCLGGLAQALCPCLPCAARASVADVRRRRKSLRTVEDKEEYDYILTQAVTGGLLRLLRAQGGLPKPRGEARPSRAGAGPRGNSIENSSPIWRQNSYGSVELTFPVTFGQAELLRQHLERQHGGVQLFGREQLEQLLRQFREGYASRHPTAVAEVDVPPPPGKLVVVGDLHGQLQDLLLIFRVHGPPRKDNVYLFNGDVADRGPNAVEMYVLLAVYFLAEPASILVNRGNHEDDNMNRHTRDEGGGFYDEVAYKFGSGAYTHFHELFKAFPLCTVVGETVFVVHGGLSLVPDVTLHMIRQIDHRSRTLPDLGCGVSGLTELERVWVDLVWSDPQFGHGCCDNARGAGCLFDFQKTKEFLANNPKIKKIIRSHELPENNTGYCRHHGNTVMTVFSASNYCSSANTGAVLIYTHDNFPSGAFYDYYAPALGTISKLSGTKASPETWEKQGMNLFHSHNQGVECDEVAWHAELQKMQIALVEMKPEIWAEFLKVTGGAAQVSYAQWSEILSAVLVTQWSWEAAWEHWGLGDAGGQTNFVDFLRRFTVVLTREEFSSFKLSAISSLYHHLMTHDLAMKEAVMRFDSDGDGLCTIIEVQSALNSLDLGLTKAQVDTILHGVFRGRESLSHNDFFARIALVFRHAEGELAASDGSQEGRLFAEAAGRIAHAVAVTPIRQLRREEGSVASGRASTLSELVAEKFAIVFDAIDEDHSGTIDEDEFVTGLWRVPAVQQGALSSGEQVTEGLLRRLFGWLDKNGDGRISIYEFLNGFEIDDPIGEKDPSAGKGGRSLGDAFAENIVSVLLRHRHSIREGVALFDPSQSGATPQKDFERVLHALCEVVQDSGHHLSYSQIGEFCEAMAEQASPDGDLAPGSYIHFERMIDSMQVVDAAFPDTGVRIGSGHKHGS